MSMTKDLFDELFNDMNTQPTERDIEEQYYWELARRQQIFLDYLQEYVESLPENFYFTADFAKYLQTQENPSELFIAKRNEGKATSDTFLDVSSVLDASEWSNFVESLPPLTLTAEEVAELKRRQLNDE